MDTYGKPASLSYATNTPVTAAGLLNDRVLPFLEQHAILLTRVLTDRQRNTDCPPYELYRALEDTDHSRTKRKAHTPNWICERFNKTLLNEFDRVVFRKRLYRLLEPMPAALDAFLEEYNTQRPHPGRWCYGKTPMRTRLDGVALGEKKADCLARERAGLTTQSRRAFREGPTATVRSHANFHKTKTGAWNPKPEPET